MNIHKLIAWLREPVSIGWKESGPTREETKAAYEKLASIPSGETANFLEEYRLVMERARLLDASGKAVIDSGNTIFAMGKEMVAEGEKIMANGREMIENGEAIVAASDPKTVLLHAFADGAEDDDVSPPTPTPRKPSGKSGRGGDGPK